MFQVIEDVHDSFIMNFLYVIPPLIAICCIYTVFKKLGYGTARGKAFLFLTLGMAFWAIAELGWLVAVVFLDVKPFPSFVDIFYLVAYPLLAIGFWLEYRMGEIRWTAKKAISLSLVSLVLIGLTGYFGIYYAYDATNTGLENLVNVLYGVGDVILSILTLLILAIVIEYKRGKFFRPWMIIFIANLLMIIADVLFAIYFNEYDEGAKLYQYMDLVWAGSYLLFAYGFYRIGYVLELISKGVIEKNNLS